VRPRLCLFLLAMALPGAAVAQAIEFTTVLGYRFGGSVETTRPGGSGPDARFEVADAASFGFQVGYRLGGGELEALYSRQGSRLQTSSLFAGAPLFDLALETWQLGGNYFLGDEDARLCPYVGIGLGLTRLLPEPASLSDETRFSASFAAGAKVRLGRRLGLRIEVRGFLTTLDGESSYFCGASACAAYVSESQTISQAEVRAGLFLRF
jgi:hypothetical protein